MIRWWRRRRSGGEDELACREFVELVTDYLEGALPEADRLRLEAHLSDCDGCSGYLEDMRLVVASLQDAVEPPADPHTREVLLSAFRDLRGSG